MRKKLGNSCLYGICRRAAALVLAGAMIFGMGGESIAFADETIIADNGAGSLLLEDTEEAGRSLLTQESEGAGEALFEEMDEEPDTAAPESEEAQTGSEAKAQSESETKAQAESETKAQSESETKAQAESETKAQSESETEAQSDSETEALSEESALAGRETEPAAQTESPEDVAESETEGEAPVMEEAEIAESRKAAVETAASAKPNGPMTVTPSFEGCTSLYNPSARSKNIVWTKDAVEGKTITLKAELKNVDLEYLKPDSSIKFTWTRNDKFGTVRQIKVGDFTNGQTDFTDSFTAKTEAGTYAFFCNIDVPDQNGDNMIESYRLVYVVKDPLTVETGDTVIHIAPHDKDQKTTGDVEMEVTALSAIVGDSYEKNPPYWHYTDQYEGISTGTVRMKDDPDTRLRTKATLKGVDDAETTVTCSVSSLFSPDEIYGERRVTFTIDTADHDWEDFTITKDATIWESGTMERTCKTCGYKDVEVISKLKPSCKKSMKKVFLQKGKSTNLYKLELQKGDSVVKWESSDHGICTVDGQKDGDCTIRARWSKGTAKVTATMDSGLVATVSVKVQDSKVATRKITGLPETLRLKKGKRIRLNPELYPLTSQEKIRYASSDRTIAYVTQKGKVRGKAPGKCYVTVTSGKISVKIKVIVPGVDAKKIYNIRKSYTLKKGKKKQLKVKLSPAKSTSKIRFRSSNRKVVTVSKNGVIRARGKGTATVKVYAVNIEHKSIVRTFKVTVK